jgi:hypothetical protein
MLRAIRMYPSDITRNEFFRFRQLLAKKGKEEIDWDVWKFTLRKNKFQALTEAFDFLGFIKEGNRLSPLGKHFVFGGEDKALIVGLIQSDYFDIFKQLLSSEKSAEELFNRFSLGCGETLPEKKRRSMFKVFTELSTTAGLLEANDGKISLTPEGKNNVKTYCKIPLWVSDLPLFAESRRIEHFKALYYETGHPLRDIVKEAFIELGFKAYILPQKVRGIPDVKIELGEFKAVIETKGEIKQIGENDVNQLTKSQSNPDFAECKFIFVGNAFRLKPPDQRGDFFHEGAISLAESKGIALLGSLTLITALQKKWKRELDLESVVKCLSESGLCSKLT